MVLVIFRPGIVLMPGWMRVWTLCKSPSATAFLRLENGQEETGVSP